MTKYPGNFGKILVNLTASCQVQSYSEIKMDHRLSLSESWEYFSSQQENYLDIFWQPLFAVPLSSFLYLPFIRFTLSLPFYKNSYNTLMISFKKSFSRGRTAARYSILGTTNYFMIWIFSISVKPLNFQLFKLFLIDFIIESKFNFRNNAFLYVKWIPWIFTAILISLTSSSSFEGAISGPNKIISVFSRLILKPEHVLYLFRVLMRLWFDWVFFKTHVISSAKMTTLPSSLPIVSPFISLSFRIWIASNSNPIINKYGESGSPWRTPRLSGK